MDRISAASDTPDSTIRAVVELLPQAPLPMRKQMLDYCRDQAVDYYGYERDVPAEITQRIDGLEGRWLSN